LLNNFRLLDDNIDIMNEWRAINVEIDERGYDNTVSKYIKCALRRWPSAPDFMNDPYFRVLL
jgi:hypothetical protein